MHQRNLLIIQIQILLMFNAVSTSCSWSEKSEFTLQTNPTGSVWSRLRLLPVPNLILVLCSGPWSEARFTPVKLVWTKVDERVICVCHINLLRYCDKGIEFIIPRALRVPCHPSIHQSIHPSICRCSSGKIGQTGNNKMMQYTEISMWR